MAYENLKMFYLWKQRLGMARLFYQANLALLDEC